MFLSDSHRIAASQNVTESDDASSKGCSSRSFRRAQLLAADPTLIRNSEDKKLEAQNPYRARGPYAMVSRNF